MSSGEFSPAARAAILEATHGRCAGCGTTWQLNTQHRHARAMGGTTDAWHGSPANGVALCGSGTTGCHGWTERQPDHARALGWRLTHLTPGEMPAPFYTTYGGWREWVIDGDPGDPRSWLVAHVHPDTVEGRAALDQLAPMRERVEAAHAHRAYLSRRYKGDAT